MKYYELLSVIPARYTETEIKEIEDRVKNLLNINGAEVLRELNFGKIRMAYPIGENRYGIYFFVIFKSEPTLIEKIKPALALFDEIIRFEINTTTEKAVSRNYNLVAYEAPMLDIERVRVERFDRPRFERKLAPQAVRAPEPVPVKQMSQEEIEAQIDKILEEKIV